MNVCLASKKHPANPGFQETGGWPGSRRMDSRKGPDGLPRDHLEPGSGNRPRQSRGPGGGRDDIVLANHHEGWNRDLPESSPRRSGRTAIPRSAPAIPSRRGLLHDREDRPHAMRLLLQRCLAEESRYHRLDDRSTIAVSKHLTRGVLTPLRFGRITPARVSISKRPATRSGMSEAPAKGRRSHPSTARPGQPGRQCRDDRATRQRRRPSRPSCTAPPGASDWPCPRRSGAITR